MLFNIKLVTFTMPKSTPYVYLGTESTVALRSLFQEKLL
jgi:hypothetical protein